MKNSEKQMIAKENSERARYNDERNISLTKLQEFYDYYNRTHMPKTAGTRFRF